MARPPTGTVTFLFTDVEGSAELWERSPREMAAALQWHDEILREVAVSWGGHVFSTAGDSFALAFDRGEDAVRAAIAAQRRLQHEPWPPAARIRVRMGLHTGEATERDENYFGPAVNRAARVMAAAHGGQILLSGTTAEVVADELDTDVRLLDLGEQVLRSLSRPERVFQVVASDMQVHFPPLADPATLRGNLPVPATPLIGRSDEVREVVGQLDRGRLVTLTGPGGVGKTRLAVEAAWMAGRGFPDGAWFVDLAPLADASAVPPVVASMLRVQLEERNEPIAALVDALRGRRLLLVLDNCEHVLDAAAGLAGRLVHTCPTVRTLATSRELLGVDGEWLRVVRSLTSQEGVDLFIDRAQATTGSFAPPPAEQAVIERICGRLDGIPLAIELAASRMRSMTPQEIEARLDDRFRLLSAGRRGGTERHHTLRAAVEWSYQFLEPATRRLFDRLSVFAGTFDLAAAQAICANDDHDRADVADALAGLVDRSLVVADTMDGKTRYRVLETLRQFGHEQIVQRDELSALLDRHLDYYAVNAEHAGPLFDGIDHALGHAILRAEWDNLRAAVGWAFTTGDAERLAVLVESTAWFGYFDARLECGEWAREAGPLTARPRIFGAAARIAAQFGDPAEAEHLAQSGIAAAPYPTHPSTTGCHWSAAAAAWYTGRAQEAWSRFTTLDSIEPDSLVDAANTAITGAIFAGGLISPDRATPYLARAADLAVRLRSTGIDAALTWATAVVSSFAGRDNEALQLCQKVLAMEGTTTFVLAPIWTSHTMATVLARQGGPDAAEAWAAAVRRIYHHRNRGMIATALESIALWWGQLGRDDAAATVLGYLDAHGHRHARFIQARTELDARLAENERAEPHLKRGRQLSQDEIVDYVLTQLQG